MCVSWRTHSWQIHHMSNYRSETLYMSYLPQLIPRDSVIGLIWVRGSLTSGLGGCYFPTALEHAG